MTTKTTVVIIAVVALLALVVYTVMRPKSPARSIPTKQTGNAQLVDDAVNLTSKILTFIPLGNGSTSEDDTGDIGNFEYTNTSSLDITGGDDSLLV